MKITSVCAAWLQFPLGEGFGLRSDFGHVKTFDGLLVRIETDTGLVGYGEGKNAAGSAGTYDALQHLVNHEVAPRLIGRDPGQITPIWDLLYNGVRADLATTRGHVLPELARRGLSIAAISAIDLALWDILGREVSLPVHRLLGGAKADRLPAYGSGGWAPADQIGEELVGYVREHDFRAVKMRVGAMDGHVRRSAERVRAARDALGWEVDLMIDAHGSLTRAEARRLCRLVEDCDLRWFEEPVTADDRQGMAVVRRESTVPIAAGESEYTRFDFRALVDADAVDVVQPDLAICGGLTEGRRVDALAATYHLELAPHMWAGALAVAAGLHLAAASSNSRIVEFPLGTDPMLHSLVREDLSPVDGHLLIPTGPGLGVTVDEDVAREFTKAGDLG